MKERERERESREGIRRDLRMWPLIWSKESQAGKTRKSMAERKRKLREKV